MKTPAREPLRVAVVGCGKIADGHVEEIQKMPAVARVVAVADLEPLMAEQVAVRYGLPAWYDDLDRMLADQRPDVVHITTPPESHLAIATRAVEAGAHVLVEKPLALTYADSRALVDRVRAAGRTLTIGWSYWFDPPVEGLRDLAARGVLGDPVHVESFLGYGMGSPFAKAVLADPGHWVHRLPGKLFQNNLDHVLYKIVPFLPDPRPDAELEADPLGDLRITAQGWIRRPQRFGDVRDEMLDELRVQIAGPGASASAWFSSHLKPAAQFTRVYGTRNSALAHQGTGTLTVDAQATLPSALGRLTPAFGMARQYRRAGMRNLGRFLRNDFHFFKGMNRLFALFYESIAAGGPPPIAYRDILRVAAWMDEVWRRVPQDGRRA